MSAPQDRLIAEIDEAADRLIDAIRIGLGSRQLPEAALALRSLADDILRCSSFGTPLDGFAPHGSGPAPVERRP